MVAMEILLPWQQDGLLISELFRGIETPVLVWDTSWLKQSFPEMVAWDGVSDQEMNCELFVLKKKIRLWFVDVVATVKILQVTPLIFTKNS